MDRKQHSISTGQWPTKREVEIYFSQKGMTEAEAKAFYQAHVKREWCTRKGKPIKNWKARAYLHISKVLKAQPWRFNKNIH